MRKTGQKHLSQKVQPYRGMTQLQIIIMRVVVVVVVVVVVFTVNRSC